MFEFLLWGEVPFYHKRQTGGSAETEGADRPLESISC
jgi:hypothetical protein